MLRISVLSALLCLYFLPATAQELTTVKVKSGVESRVGGGWNCSAPQNVPVLVIQENPSHGTIAVKDLPSGSPCGNGPMKGVFYTSQPGYKGPDRVGFQLNYVGRGAGRGAQSFTRNIVVN